MKAAELVYVTPMVPEHLKSGFDRIRNLTREECVALWNKLNGDIYDVIRQKSQLVFHFHKEGWDIHELNNGHTYIYLEMAFGKILPQLYVALTGVDPALLNIASKLTIPDQGRVVANEKVPVLLSFKDNGQPYFQDMELQTLAPSVAKNVMRGGKILSEDEQIAHMRMKAKTKLATRIGKLTPDFKRGGAVCKINARLSVFHSLAELEAMVNTLRAAN